MNRVHDKPAEVTATEFRQDIARTLRNAEYGIPTVITRDRQPVAKVVHPDAGVTPSPDVWQAAQEAYDRAVNSDWYRKLPLTAQSALAALAAPIRAYYGYDSHQPAKET